eukprot:4134909-Pleurochrysis_carterae.AAC.1
MQREANERKMQRNDKDEERDKKDKKERKQDKKDKKERKRDEFDALRAKGGAAAKMIKDEEKRMHKEKS